MPLEMKVRIHENVAVVECFGRIVFGAETTALHTGIKTLLSDNPNVVLNLGGVRDIDSSGIGTLVGLFASALAKNGELKLACLGPKVRQSLQITRLLGLFREYGTEDEAVAAFGEKHRAAS